MWVLRFANDNANSLLIIERPVSLATLHMQMSHYLKKKDVYLYHLFILQAVVIDKDLLLFRICIPRAVSA